MEVRKAENGWWGLYRTYVRLLLSPENSEKIKKTVYGSNTEQSKDKNFN